VIGTSTQPNALNQDLGGPDGATTSALTWAALGAVSFPESPSPEPAGLAPAALALAALVALRRRRA
jgi:MYXO-CTERM domain-containing protein